MVFDFMSTKMGGQEFRVAEPEKALLDHWHLTKGEWTLERLNTLDTGDVLADVAPFLERPQDAELLTRTNLEVLLS